VAGEIASAFLSIYPKLESKAVANEIGKGMSGAGKSAGSSFADGASASMKSGMGSAGQTGAQSLADGFSAAKVAVGHVIGELALDAANEFKERFSDGVEQSDALQKFASTMEFAGFDTGEIERVQSAMKTYADQTVYDLGEVMATTSKLAANGTEDFDTLVQAIGNLNAAAGGDSASFGYLANAITQVNGAGKLMSQDWNQIVNALPGASGAIQNELLAMGAWDDSMGSFRDALSNGEITAEEFNTAIQNLGMTDVAQQAATSSTTFEGAMGQLDASVTNTMQGIYDSLNENDRITNAINGLATAFQVVSPYVSQFADAFGDFAQTVAPVVPIIAGVVAGIAAASAITGIIGAIAGAVTFLTTVVGPALAMVGSVPGLIALVTSVLGGPITIIAAVAGAIIAFVATNENARTAIVNAFNAIKTGVTNALNAAKATVTNVANAIVNGVRNKFNSLVGTVQGIFNRVKTAIMTPINAAKSAVQSAINRISSIIRGVKLQLPHINLPHFSVSGGKAPWGIAGKGSLPKFSVSWYARGGYFDQPTLLAGVGERGGEFVWPSYAPYLDRYADALASRIGGGGGQVVNLYLDGMRVNDDAAIRQDVLNLVSDLSRYNAAMTAARG
jgi:tape measure domain-containing protein